MATMLTTTDNLFDPFDDYDEWLAFDTAMGYNTNELLARIVITSDELSEEQQIEDTEVAIEEIISINASGMHRKIVRE